MMAFLLDCSSETVRPEDEFVLPLRWVKAYEDETIKVMEEGLRWSLSWMGALLPREGFRNAIHYKDETRFDLDLSKLGFSDLGLEAIRIIFDKLKQSEEYRVHASIDVGRFLVLTAHSSWHYYEITGVAKTLPEFLQRKEFDNYQTFAVVNSSISKVNRIIQLQVSEQIDRIAFVAHETKDDPNNAMYTVDHYEVFDVMPNGQLRFAIYDGSGKLMSAAPGSSSCAGKPSKCLWCHETNVQTLFMTTPDINGFISADAFRDLVRESNRIIQAYRQTLSTDLNFNEQQNHTLAELLYITFMESSAMRIQNEWQVSLDEVMHAISDLPSHEHHEFQFLGTLFRRGSIDERAPYHVVNVPGSVREMNNLEPNFFDE